MYKIYFLFLLLMLNNSCQNAEGYDLELSVKYFKVLDENIADSKKTIICLNKIITQAEKANDYNLLSMCYSSRGYSYYLLNDNRASLNDYKKGLEYGRKSKDNSGKSLNLAYMWIQENEMKIENNINLLAVIDEVKKNSNEVYKNYTLGTLYNVYHINKNLSPSEKLQYLNKAINAYKKVPQWQSYNLNLIKIYHNISLLELENGNFCNAIETIKLAEFYNTNNQRDDLIFYSYAEYYYRTGHYDKAIYYSKKNLEIKKNELGLIPIYSILENSNNKIGKFKDAIFYNKKKTEYVNKFSNNRIKVLSDIYVLNQNKKNEVKFYIPIGLSLIFIIVVVFFTIKYLNQKTKKTDSKLVNKTEAYNSIDDDTENEILKKLEVFEQKYLFLEKGFTAVKLANYTKTNVRYLSEVIKKHKGVSFNGYINELRINYIIYKLNNEPEYLKYKVSYLSELLGYSNVGAFSKIFSSLVGSTPSKYIENMKK